MGPPVASAVIRYETPSTLLLCKILKPEIPSHAAILNSFAETRFASAPAHHPRHEEPSGSVGSTVRGRAPRVSLRVSENLAANEELICDLTGGNDAPPQWAKRKKRALDRE